MGWRLLERRQPIHLYRRRLSVLLELVPYWGWRYPYAYYSYYPSYWYAYDSCSVSRQRFFGP